MPISGALRVLNDCENPRDQAVCSAISLRSHEPGTTHHPDRFAPRYNHETALRLSDLGYPSGVFGLVDSPSWNLQRPFASSRTDMEFLSVSEPCWAVRVG